MATADSIPTSVASEEWRPVVGYEGWYSVSNLSRVRRDRGGKGTRAVGHILTARTDKQTGYLRLHLVKDGIDTVRTVHSLVAEAFIGPRPEGGSVNHIDGDKTNNAPGNLEYLSLADNVRHAFASGLYPAPVTHCHAGHPYDAANTITHKNGDRDCRECSRRRKREYKARRRSALNPHGAA